MSLQALSRVCLVVLAAAACGGAEPPAAPVDSGVDAPAMGDGGDVVVPSTAQVLSRAFGPWPLAPGAERTTMCTSWTLNNDQPLYVNTVEMTATTGMHHSNWFFVPEANFAGPDGDWECSARQFDQGVASFLGGVFFAQSTQVRSEAQRFPAGAAFVVPPRSRVIGALHLLNTARDPASVNLGLTVRTLARDEVRTRLSPFYLEYHPLNIPARARAQFEVECDLTERVQALNVAPLSMRFFYGLAHYHDLGSLMRVSVVGGARDGATLYESESSLGDSWARTMDPAVEVSGARALKLTCVFDNPNTRAVRYGNGNGEMCIFFGFTDHPYQWAGRANSRAMATRGATVDGVVQNTAPCNEIVATRSRYFGM